MIPLPQNRNETPLISCLQQASPNNAQPTADEHWINVAHGLAIFPVVGELMLCLTLIH